jgi:hypothetical protein
LKGVNCGLEQAFLESLQRTHDNNRSPEKKGALSPIFVGYSFCKELLFYVLISPRH